MPRRGRPPHDDVLTPAEWRTVHAVQHGMTNREIAQRRGISIDAVKYHVGNALAKLGLDRRAALKAWFRAPRSSRLARTEMHMKPLQIGTIGQIARSVRDTAVSEAWYRDVLGLRHLYTFGTLAFFDCGGTRLMLTSEGGAKDESILYFRVEDIVGASQTLAARGVAFAGPPHMIHRHADGTEEWMAFFKDAEDRVLALMAQVRA